MNLRLCFLTFSLFFIFSSIYSIDITPQFLMQENSTVLKELFTVNIGVMEPQILGRVNSVSPLEISNITNNIKNNIDLVPALSLSKKASLYKAVLYCQKKATDDASKRRLSILGRRILYASMNNIPNSLVTEVYNELKINSSTKTIVQKWFDNYISSNYVPKTAKTFGFVLEDNRVICETYPEVSSLGKLDFLISGDIKRVDNLYFVFLYVYSYLEDRKLAEINIVSDKDNMEERIKEKIQDIIPKIFLVRYGKLTVKSDSETYIYLNQFYIGKETAIVDFVVPDNYLLLLRKDGYEDFVTNITIRDWDIKSIEQQVIKQKRMQIVNFSIQPYNSKIFINGVYEGKSPFKKALPIGEYIVSSSNPLFESKRYLLSITDVEDEEKIILFHLKSKDLKTNFAIKKSLYYTAFWNFTFSLVGLIISVSFAYDYFYKYGAVFASYKQLQNETKGFYDQELLDTISLYYEVQRNLYGVAGFSIAYTALSLGWLFFTLADYLATKSKYDFVPILEFYNKNIDNNNENDISYLKIGARLKF